MLSNHADGSFTNFPNIQFGTYNSSLYPTTQKIIHRLIPPFTIFQATNARIDEASKISKQEERNSNTVEFPIQRPIDEKVEESTDEDKNWSNLLDQDSDSNGSIMTKDDGMNMIDRNENAQISVNH